MLTIFTDLLAIGIFEYADDASYPQHYEITAAIWLFKTLCKLPFYIQLGLYCKDVNLSNYLGHSFSTLIFFNFVHLISFFLIDNTDMLIIVTVVLTTLSVVLCGIPSREKILIPSYIFVVYSFIEIINSYLMKCEFPLVFWLLGISMLIIILVCCNYGINGMKIAFKVINVCSVTLYFLCITYMENLIRFPFLLTITGVLIAVSLFFICYNYKSAYAMIFLMYILVFYNLIKVTSTDITILIQATGQIRMVGVTILLMINYVVQISTTAKQWEELVL